MTPEERAAAIGAAIGDKTIRYTYLGITFSVGGCVVSGPAVSVTVAAWTGAGGNRVDLPVDDLYVFVNPPLAVPDGGVNATGHKTFTRDDLAAAQLIVHEAVTGYALAHGWTP